VLYLCFNQLLAQHIRLSLAGAAEAKGIDVRHVHALYYDVIADAGMLDRLELCEPGSRELFATVFPQTFVDAVLEKGMTPWDALVVDEAQDLLTEDNLDAFDLMVENGLNRGRWHLFFDPLQNIYGADVQEAVEKRLAEAQPAFDDLYENCRNTRQVAVQGSIVSGIDFALDGAPDGPECENVYYRDRESFPARLEATVKDLIARDVRPQDIAILSTRRRENSLIAGVTQLAGVPVVDAEEAGEGKLLFSTMHAFKGLERLVVLAIDMEEIGHPQWSMLHYAGLSRARGLLRVFLPESARGAYAQQAATFAARNRT
jgi:hypothetical protein